MSPWIRVCTTLDSFLADLSDSAHRLDPTALSPSATPVSSSVLDMSGYTMGQGEITILWVAASKRLTSVTSQRERRRNRPYFDSYLIYFKFPFSNIGHLRRHGRDYENSCCTRYKWHNYHSLLVGKLNTNWTSSQLIGRFPAPQMDLRVFLPPLLDSNSTSRQGAYHITAASWIMQTSKI